MSAVGSIQLEKTNRAPAEAQARTVPTFDELYETYFDYVWLNIRRLGVPDAAVSDVCQEVFFAVHRGLNKFEGNSHVKTWVFGIMIRCVRKHWRSSYRKDVPGTNVDPETVGSSNPDPASLAEAAEEVRTLHMLLGELRDEYREILVLAEIEDLPIVEVATMLEINLNTAYSRLRAARRDFEAALSRHRARSERRTP